MGKKKAKQQKKFNKELQRLLAAQLQAAQLPGGAALAMPPGGANMLGRLQGLLGKRPRDQFLIGALLGAAAVYVLGNEELRGRLMKSGMQLYAGLLGSFEEMREQMADLQAEVECARQEQP
jgi:hypothetical protein